jgi:hypothetical protein
MAQRYQPLRGASRSFPNFNRSTIARNLFEIASSPSFEVLFRLRFLLHVGSEVYTKA